jgi:hypothetical protein
MFLAHSSKTPKEQIYLPKIKNLEILDILIWQISNDETVKKQHHTDKKENLNFLLKRNSAQTNKEIKFSSCIRKFR